MSFIASRKFFVLFGLALGLISVEAAVRIGIINSPALSHQWAGKDNEILFRRSSNPRITYELKPNFRTQFPNSPVTIETNSLGFRDIEHSPEKSPGTKRIVILADSIGIGWGLPRDDIFSARLRERLAPRKEPIEVIDLSVGGYDTVQEAETLRDKGVPLSPDVVVLIICLNDLAPGNDNLVSFYYDSTGFYSLDLARMGLRSLWARFIESPVERGAATIAELQKQHGFRTLAVISPFFELRDGAYPHQAAHERIARALTKHSIPYLDLREVLTPEQLRSLGDDVVHPNRDGIVLYSRLVLDNLLERGLISR